MYYFMNEYCFHPADIWKYKKCCILKVSVTRQWFITFKIFSEIFGFFISVVQFYFGNVFLISILLFNKSHNETFNSHVWRKITKWFDNWQVVFQLKIDKLVFNFFRLSYWNCLIFVKHFILISNKFKKVQKVWNNSIFN